MKKITLTIVAVNLMVAIFAQKNIDKAIFKTFDKGESYYYSTILKGINQYQK